MCDTHGIALVPRRREDCWGILRQSTLLFCTVVLLSTAPSHAADQACILCGKDPALGHALVEYRGIGYAACEGLCDLVWLQAELDGHLDGIVEKMEPRSAWFQGDSKFLNPVYQQANPMSGRWLVAGLWVLIAMVSAGLAGSWALTTRRSVPLAFAMGLALPVVGLLLTLVLTKRAEGFDLRGTKIPSTHDEIACTTCGHALHPSAATCPGCGATQTPTLESEVHKTLHKGTN